MFNFSRILGNIPSIVRGATGRSVPWSRVAKAKKAPFSWRNLLTSATSLAKRAGLKMPMQSELSSLAAKRKELNSLKLRAQSISKTVSNSLASRRDSSISVAAAATLKKTSSQACAQVDAAIRLIDAAIRDGNLAVEKMKYGTSAFKPSATFFTKKAVADRVYSIAKNRIMLVISASEVKQNQSFGNEMLPSASVGNQNNSSSPSRGSGGGGEADDSSDTDARGADKPGSKRNAPGLASEYAVPIVLGLVGLYAISQRSND